MSVQLKLQQILGLSRENVSIILQIKRTDDISAQAHVHTYMALGLQGCGS